MIVLIRRKSIGFACLFLLFLCGMALVLWEGRMTAVKTISGAPLSESCVIVVDPGHGGEDGGAVASNGTVESGINLAIASRLNDLLRLCGCETQMTRREDVSIYSEGSGTLHEKKVSDLKNRVAMVNGLDCGVLVSIHQNCLPSSPRVHGAQVFYNTVDGAEDLALSIQDSLNLAVNPENEKSAKQIPPSIYLMKEVTAPAVLVECGFLSNTEETEKLQQPSYQLHLAAAIASGILQNTTT